MWLVVSGVYTLDEGGKVTGSVKVPHEKQGLNKSIDTVQNFV